MMQAQSEPCRQSVTPVAHPQLLATVRLIDDRQDCQPAFNGQRSVDVVKVETEIEAAG